MSELGVEKERYQRLNSHFQACAELPELERDRYVSKVHASDPDLGKELQSLLKYHVSDLEPTTPRPLPTPSSAKEGTRSHRKKKWAGIPMVILAGGAISFVSILIAQVWAMDHLETHLKTETTQTLRAAVDFRVSGIRAWAARQKEQAEKVLTEPELVTQIASLLELARESEGLKERLLASPAYKRVSDRMQQVSPDLGSRGFIVHTLSGLGLCSESEAIVARPVSAAGGAYLRRMNLGEWIVSRPYPSRQFAVGMTPDYKNPVMFVGGPIRDASGQVIATAVFRFSPARFYEFLAPSSFEFLAFDEKQLLLNEIGDADVLRQLGVVSEDGAALRATLRDPGLELHSGEPLPERPDTWPPTLMVRTAVRGIDGVDEQGHRDLRGRTVLAAWTWLPEWEMGVGGQTSLNRVLAPTDPVRATFRALLAVPLFLTMALLVATRFFRIRRRSSEDGAFGAYVLERPIGKGGMAEVFLARHATLKRPAAVKILTEANPHPSSIERFEREARLASRLGHPNTIQVFDYGETPDGRLYFAMEYVKGLNLAQFLTIGHPLPVARVIYLLKQIAGSLEEAHQVGLLHRDLKPSNIMVGSKGGMGDVVKVLDFGIACAVEGGTEDNTRSIALVGTPAFIAPERIRTPQVLDVRSDIYSFGAVAFHLLTGRNVFEAPGPSELIYQVLSAPRPSPSRLRGEALPEALEQLVLRCLAIEADSRPANFREVLDALQTVRTEDRWSQDEARLWWTSNHDRVAQFVQATT